MQFETLAAKHNNIPYSGITIFNTYNRRYYNLDAVAALVWKLIQQPQTFSEICDVITNTFGIERESCEQDISLLLQQMEAEGLIEAESDQIAS